MHNSSNFILWQPAHCNVCNHCLIDEEDVVIAKYLLMNSSEALIDVGPIEIRDDSMSEGRKVFNISIGTIEENSYGIIPSVTTAVRGDPVKIIAYDNDCKFFVQSQTSSK